MLPVCDYHMHTPLCGHAEGKLEDFVEKAITVGFTEIGFSDHAPLVSHEDRSITMGFEQLPLYHRMVEDLRKKFEGRITVKIGLEADFLPGYEDKTKEIIDSYPYDYIIGSVHHIREWAFDNPKKIHVWKAARTDEVYIQYHEKLRRSALSGMFDIMGHVDLVKKFGHRPKNDISAEVRKTAKVFKEAGVVIEINTSGLRKPVKEMYPSLSELTIYREEGVPITFGSDAHKPSEVGADFLQATELAKAAGYTVYVLFSKRNKDFTGQL